MKKIALLLVGVGFVVSCVCASDNVYWPESSIPKKQDRGVRAHTNHLIYTGPRWFNSPPPTMLASAGPFLQGTVPGYHPADIHNAYKIKDNRGQGVIAIVDAFDLPTKLSDFNAFARAFNLPVETSTDVTAASNQVFQTVYQNGTQPTADAGWGGEIALDIEWAHAMAPNAKIVLFEASDNSDANLFAMEAVAGAFPGVKEVSNSWGGDESIGELDLDRFFTAPGVVYFASTGDIAGLQSYPALSPNVVGVGGTHLEMSGGVVTLESAWSGGVGQDGTGGGPSAFEPRPAYQNIIQSIVHGVRGNPDISAVADPETGVAVYNSSLTGGPWFVFGGTSVACPVCAAIANAREHYKSSVADELDRIYNDHYANKRPFWADITQGLAGTFPATLGWDFTTGVGAPRGMYPSIVYSLHPGIASSYTGAGGATGAAGVAAASDGVTFDVSSVPVAGVGQVAAGLFDSLATTPIANLEDFGLTATVTSVPHTTIQFFMLNWSTNHYDLIKSWQATGVQQVLHISLPAITLNNHYNLARNDPSGQDHLSILIRGLIPARYSVGGFALSVDEVVFSGFVPD